MKENRIIITALEINKIYCENCLETMSRMPDGFIDLTVTSPPYDNLRDYNGFEFDWKAVIKDLFRVTKEGGVVVWVVGDATIKGDETGTSFRQALCAKECGFKLYDTMIYAKAGNGCPQNPYVRYSSVFEYMFVLTKGLPKTFNPIMIYDTTKKGRVKKSKRQKNGTLLKGVYNSGAGCPARNIFQYAASNGSIDKEHFMHSAPFPEKLAKDHIYRWSNEGDLVYDPFMGSGTTAKAAHLLKRNWIGSEIAQEYVDLANKRLKPYLAQTRLF